MADEIHPTRPLAPTIGVDTPADEKRRHKPKEKDDEQSEDGEKANTPPKRPPKTGIIDEYV